MALDPHSRRAFFRWMIWPLWLGGTWAAFHGTDAFEDLGLFLTIFLPVLPLLAIPLFLDLARLRRAQVARRSMGRENYDRYLAEFRRLPEVPALWSLPVRALLLLTPFVLFSIVVGLELADALRRTGWVLAIGYSGLFSLTVLIADVSAGARYRRGRSWSS